MIVSVSTVKTAVANLRLFVRRNLMNGIDHMLIFLDYEGDLEAKFFLDAHPNVTCVLTDDSWWRGERPSALNERQNSNANVAKVVLAQHSWAEWLFHIDSDEVVLFDRTKLEALSESVEVVQLAPLEAVSERRGRRSSTFKRLLSEDELTLLAVLGVIRGPDNKLYFHGHLSGKSGIRPSLNLFAGIHKPTNLEGSLLAGLEDDWLRVLHFESSSADDFVRKWHNLASSGPRPKIRPSRGNIMTALEALSAANLPDRVQHKYLMRLYERTTEDDVRTLLDLGLVEKIDPDAPRYEPRPLGPADSNAITQMLDGVRSVPKQVFRTGAPTDVEAALRAAW